MTKRHLRRHLCHQLRPSRMVMLDDVYEPTSPLEVTAALSNFTIMLNPEANRKDCDDYTFVMLGHLKQSVRGTLGFAISKGRPWWKWWGMNNPHMFIVFTTFHGVWVIDPFSKALFTYEEAKMDYFERYKRIKLVVI